MYIYICSSQGPCSSCFMRFLCLQLSRRCAEGVDMRQMNSLFLLGRKSFAPKKCIRHLLSNSQIIGVKEINLYLNRNSRIPCLVRTISTSRIVMNRDESQAEKSNTEESNKEEPKGRILLKSLDHVKEYGWTTEAIAAGARDLGYPSIAHGMLQRGPIELVEYFMEKSNEEMSLKLTRMSTELEQMNVQKRLHTAMKIRLELLIPYIRSWHQAMALGARPENVQNTIRSLAILSDDIWYHSGDKSSDVSWYTKRGVISAIYAATEFFMLTDYSEDFENTWDFLNSRIEEVATIGEMPSNLQGIAGVMGISVKSMFSAVSSLTVPVVSQVLNQAPGFNFIDQLLKQTSSNSKCNNAVENPFTKFGDKQFQEDLNEINERVEDLGGKSKTTFS